MKRRELVDHILTKKSFLCVGLDPDVEKLPARLRQDATDAQAVLTFNKAIIDATAPFCVAYKPNLAFYECLGAEGWSVLKQTIEYIKNNHPDQFVIADAKRGDIGNTARMYAKAIFEGLGADAVTLSPYMGEDSIEPFTQTPDKWAIVLALTSNKGSKDLQMLIDKHDRRVYEALVRKSSHWGTPVNMMYVVGATQGELIGHVRKLAPRHFFLVPGVGAQGGSLDEVARFGLNDEVGLLVNSSRGIIYASGGQDFAEAAAKAAAQLQGQMAEILTNAGFYDEAPKEDLTELGL